MGAHHHIGAHGLVELREELGENALVRLGEVWEAAQELLQRHPADRPIHRFRHRLAQPCHPHVLERSRHPALLPGHTTTLSVYVYLSAAVSPSPRASPRLSLSLGASLTSPAMRVSGGDLLKFDSIVESLSRIYCLFLSPNIDDPRAGTGPREERSSPETGGRRARQAFPAGPLLEIPV